MPTNINDESVANNWATSVCEYGVRMLVVVQIAEVDQRILAFSASTWSECEQSSLSPNDVRVSQGAAVIADLCVHKHYSLRSSSQDEGWHVPLVEEHCLWTHENGSPSRNLSEEMSSPLVIPEDGELPRKESFVSSRTEVI